MAKAVVTNIQGYSIHDGPGIRTTVFLKGCPLKCRWCANPENLSGEIQVGFIADSCRHCGACLSACKHGGIAPEGVYRINRANCTSCSACTEVCYYGALVKYGEEMTAQQAFDKVRRDKMFFDASGGGVTVSGGEPLLHPDFVYELFSLCHGEGISTCIETCGFVPWESFEMVLPVTGMFYFDLKLMDESAHIAYTGRSNRLILSNAAALARTGANILFRQPLIPGVNDSPAHISASAEFIKSIGGKHSLQLMPYHRMGTSKYAALNMPYTLETLSPMSADTAEKAAEGYRRLGVDCTVSR